MKHSVLSLVLLLGIGCGSENTEAPAEEAPPAAESAPGEAPEAEAEAAPAEDTAEGLQEVAENGPEGLQEAAGALGAALQAANEAEGETHCQQGYNAIRNMIEALQAQRPGGESHLPPEDEFLAACNELGEDAQQCLVPSYGMAHAEECGEVMQREDVMAFQAAMRGN